MVSRKQHPAELRERAVAMVFELRAESGSTRGTLARVGERLGINPETLRNWVERAEIGNGQRPGVTGDDKRRITELERENRELRQRMRFLRRRVHVRAVPMVSAAKPAAARAEAALPDRSRVAAMTGADSGVLTIPPSMFRPLTVIDLQAILVCPYFAPCFWYP